MQPLASTISVVMATRNAMPFLEEQLASCFSQSFPVQEIVICDDASSDGTAECIRRFDAAHPGIIRLSVNDSPLGATRNFEKALQLSSGDFLFFCDQDDIWLPDRCEKMMALFPKCPDEPAAVFCDSLLADANGNTTGERYWALRGFPELAKMPPGVLENQLELFCRRVPCAGHEMALNRAAKELLLPFSSLENSYDTWLGIAGAALGLWRICPEGLTLFRQHGNNTSDAGKKHSLWEEWGEAKRSVRENTFLWNAMLFQEILLHFPTLPESIRQTLTARRDHSGNRAAMTGSFLHRFPLIWQEFRNGNYARFGRSWKSMLQDLLLPRK